MLNKIKLSNATLTGLAQAAFAENSTEQQQRDFINTFATLTRFTSPAQNDERLKFTFDVDKLPLVKVMLKGVTGKKLVEHSHNDQLDITCDLVYDKYRVILRHDYNDYKIVTVELYTLNK